MTHRAFRPSDGLAGRLPRRRVLALLGLGIVGACTRSGSPQVTPSTPAPAPVGPTPTPTPTATPDSPILPTAVAWEASPDEVYPNAKTAAARIVEELLTHPVGSRAEELVAASPLATGSLDRQAAAAALRVAVDPERQSLGIVVYPQLGGLDPTPESGKTVRRGSVMVVVDQFLVSPEPQAPEDVERIRRTVDVRLEVVDGAWVWHALGDVGGEPVERPDDLSPQAVAVLDDDRIDLPHSARWDIHRGVVDDELLGVMAEMAERAPYRVTCLRSGHPRHVFGKKSVSNHHRGRAVDVWSVGDGPVVLQRPAVLDVAPSRETAAHRMTAALLDATTVSELGSPWDLDGPVTTERPSTRSFTNTVHADHLHVAFEDPAPGSASDAG